MRLLAIAASLGFYLWALWRSLPYEAHHVINILACFALLTIILTLAGQ